MVIEIRSYERAEPEGEPGWVGSLRDWAEANDAFEGAGVGIDALVTVDGQGRMILRFGGGAQAETCAVLAVARCILEGAPVVQRDDDDANEHEAAHRKGPVDARVCQGLGCPFGDV